MSDNSAIDIFKLREIVAKVVFQDIDRETLTLWINNPNYPAQAYINAWAILPSDFETVEEAIDFVKAKFRPKPKNQGFMLSDYLADDKIWISVEANLENGAHIRNVVSLELPEQNQAVIATDATVVVWRLIRLAAEKIGSEIVTIKSERSNNAPLAMNEEKVYFETMRVSFDAKTGKQAKLVGGEFQKHGVPVYPETLLEIGIDFDELPMGETEFKRFGIVLMREGRPKKVIRIV